MAFNKTRNFKIREKILAAVFVAALVVSVVSVVQPKANAATLTNMWVTETNMDASGSGQVYVAFKTASADTSGTWTIAFSGGATVAATQPTSTANCTSTFSYLAGITALPSGFTASGTSSTITLNSVPLLSTSTAYCVAFTSATAITNPSTAGVYTYTITGTTDSGTESYSVLGSAVNNTIAVSATVPQSFSLSLGTNTDALGTLASGSVTTSPGVIATVSTNAVAGLGVWAYDTNTGLHSTNATYTIASTSPLSGSLQTLTVGTEGYVTNAAYQGGSATGTAPTTTVPFTGVAGKGDGLNATPAEIASGAGAESGAQIKITESAAISSLTKPATDYGDSVTVVGAGSF